ncbi:amylo-alpha-1,6-glucosidase [Verrucomicrobiales bacterium]|nr:amylo-alpha-1,6-glucosidase [Verrucomicrobiales bacterium]
MSNLTNLPPADAEWLETDGLGGFASGSVSGIRSRRYHALLITAKTPPTDRVVLVNDFDAWLETPTGVFPLTVQRYEGNEEDAENPATLVSFEAQPMPKWTHRLEDGIEIEMELLMPHEKSAVFLRWKMTKGDPEGARLLVRPFLSGRDMHALHHENPDFCFLPMKHDDGSLVWSSYPGIPSVTVRSNGTYRHEPLWYRNFFYSEELHRGQDCLEDLVAPGVFSFDLKVGGRAELAFAVEGHEAVLADAVDTVFEQEVVRRTDFPSPLHRSADAYLVRRGKGRTIIAGYPWFADWGRDTFISMRGICLATGRWEAAEEILLEWANQVDQGLLPNRFQDYGEDPEYNSVDAALWFVVVVKEFLDADRKVAAAVETKLREAVQAILDGYAKGTLHGIRMDSDGLLACGEPGLQLTWMDAKVGDWVVTPRIGKPVEIQALWLNALSVGATNDPRWAGHLETGLASFRDKFWNEDKGSLFDVIDVDHESGRTDPSICPNQIFAIGGLPMAIIEGEQARRALEVVESHLLTPIGLRSLAPEAEDYAPRYEGGVRERDGSYHMGTVWPWLIGGFVDAWLRVHGDTEEKRKEARERFIIPLREHLGVAGLGHVSEIADGDAPHTPRGCPFQAWSVGELIRLETRLS